MSVIFSKNKNRSVSRDEKGEKEIFEDVQSEDRLCEVEEEGNGGEFLEREREGEGVLDLFSVGPFISLFIYRWWDLSLMTCR